jgi:hypothetical protein
MVGDREGIFNSITVEMLRKKIIKYRRNSKLTKVAKLLVPLTTLTTYHVLELKNGTPIYLGSHFS